MSSISFDIFARDHASDTFDKLGKKVDNTSSIFQRHKGAIVGAAAAAGAAIVAFGKQSIDAYVDAEKSQRVLEDAYRRFPAIADVSIEAYRDMAAAMQNKTKFDGDEINALQGKLAAYGLTGDELRQLTPLVLDYAEKTGKDLPTAAEDMGKAILGQTRALKAVGLDLEDTGTKTGNLDQLMGGLRRQVGGFAEQEGKSAEGRMAILSNKFGDLQEAVGEKLLPVLEKSTDVLMVLVGVAGSVGEAVGQIPAPVLAAVAGLTALHMLKGPLGAMGASVSGVMGALRESFGYAQQAAERAGGGMRGFTAGAKTMTGGLGGLKSGLGGIVNMLGGPYVIALGVATMALTHWWQEGQKADAISRQLASTVDETTGAFTDASVKSIKETFFGDLSASDIQLLEGLGVNFDKVARNLLAGGEAAAKQRTELADLMGEHQGVFTFLSSESKATEGLLRSYDRAAEGAEKTAVTTERLAGKTGNVIDAAASAAPVVDALSGEYDEAGNKATTAADAVKALALATLEITNAALGADAANASYQASLDAATAAAEKNGKTTNKARTELNLGTDAGRANAAALRQLAQDALGAAEANLKNGSSADTVTKSIMGKGGARDAFIEQAVKMGLSKDAAAALATKYGLTKDSVNNLKTAMDKIPKQVKSEIQVENATGLARVRAMERALAGIPDERVNIVVATVTRGNRWADEIADARTRAKGGPVKAGEVYAVGDNPDGSWNDTTELFLPDTDGRILNAADTRALMRSGALGGGPAVAPAAGGKETFVGTVQFFLDSRMVHESLLQLKRTSGGVELGLA